MTETEIINKLGLGLYCEVFMTGSKVICNPPPVGTDTDYVVCTYDLVKFAQVNDFLKKLGFTIDGEDEEFAEYGELNGQFVSFRKDNLNFIVTNSCVFFRKFFNATEIAKAQNLLKKADRIRLFQAILYDRKINTIDTSGDPI